MVVTPLMEAGCDAGAAASAALARLECKQAVVRGLIEGRLGLLEAATRFREQCPGARTDDSVDETCRTVIGWAHLMLSDRPEQAEALSARWERELQTQLDEPGGVSPAHTP